MHRQRRCVGFQIAVFIPCFAWKLMKQQFLAKARLLLLLDILYLWCKHHDPLSHLAAKSHNALGYAQRMGAGRGAGRVGTYIYMENYTDQENEVLTTRITVLIPDLVS